MCTQKKIKIAFSMKMVLEQTATAIKLIAAVFCAKIFIYKAYLGASGQNLKKWPQMTQEVKKIFFSLRIYISHWTTVAPWKSRILTRNP